MNDLYNRYALALLSIAKDENKVQEYRDEILSFNMVLKENPSLIQVFSSYFVTEEEKEKVLDILNKYYSKNLINFIKVVLKNGRAYYLTKIFKESLLTFDDYLKIEQGTIYSTIPLTKKDIEKVILAIERNTGKKVVLKNVIDKSLIGGIKVVLKNDIYDASILSKISALKESLLKKGN